MKLALGTAQFGLDYGIANAAGRPPTNEVTLILGDARRAGLDTLDTATAYGESEKVLGRIGLGGWKVISKVPSLPGSATNGRQWVVEHVRRSLDTLGVARLNGVLLHSARDLLDPVQGAQLVAGLQAVKAEGLVEKVGYSIYGPQVLPDLVKVMPPDMVQAPLNVLDQRLVNSGWLDRLMDAGAEVHARSVFLQGLLLMESARRPALFDRWKVLWQRWDTLVGAHGGDALSVCLGFAKAQSNLSRIVVGVDSRLHLAQLLAAWQAAVHVDVAELSCDDEQLVEPFNWEVR